MPRKTVLVRDASLLAALAFLSFAVLVGAPSFTTSTVTASVTVNSYVETSLNTSAIAFGSLDPNTVNSSATNQLLLTNTANSNTAVDVYLYSTDFNATAPLIMMDNMSASLTSGGTYYSFKPASWLSGNSSNSGIKENLAVSGTQDFFFKLNVPAGQAPGEYSASMTVKATANGNAP